MKSSRKLIDQAAVNNNTKNVKTGKSANFQHAMVSKTEVNT